MGPGAPGARRRSLRAPGRERRVRAYSFGFGGIFLPALRASERPMARACLGLVTFFPLRPLFSLPCFISRISRSTFLLAEGEYLRAPALFFAADFLAGDFLA